MPIQAIVGPHVYVRPIKRNEFVSCNNIGWVGKVHAKMFMNLIGGIKPLEMTCYSKCDVTKVPILVGDNVWQMQ